MILNTDNNLKRWHAVYTRSRFEKKVNEQFCKKNIECYLPLHNVRRRWSDRVVELELPLFASYLFVKITPKSNDFFQIYDTRGVVTILGNNGNPLYISEEEIMSIKKSLSLKKTITSIPHLQKGKRVKVTAGPLCGVEGVFEKYGRKNRLFITIESIGQSIIVDIDSLDVTAI